LTKKQETGYKEQS